MTRLKLHKDLLDLIRKNEPVQISWNGQGPLIPEYDYELDPVEGTFSLVDIKIEYTDVIAFTFSTTVKMCFYIA